MNILFTVNLGFHSIPRIRTPLFINEKREETLSPARERERERESEREKKE